MPTTEVTPRDSLVVSALRPSGSTAQHPRAPESMPTAILIPWSSHVARSSNARAVNYPHACQAVSHTRTIRLSHDMADERQHEASHPGPTYDDDVSDCNGADSSGCDDESGAADYTEHDSSDGGYMSHLDDSSGELDDVANIRDFDAGNDDDDSVADSEVEDDAPYKYHYAQFIRDTRNTNMIFSDLHKQEEELGSQSEHDDFVAYGPEEDINNFACDAPCKPAGEEKNDEQLQDEDVPPVKALHHMRDIIGRSAQMYKDLTASPHQSMEHQAPEQALMRVITQWTRRATSHVCRIVMRITGG